MGRLVRKPRVPDLDLQIAGLESVLQSDIAGMQMADTEPGDNYSSGWSNIFRPK